MIQHVLDETKEYDGNESQANRRIDFALVDPHVGGSPAKVSRDNFDRVPTIALDRSNDVKGELVEPSDRLVPMGRALFGIGVSLVVLRGLTLATRMPGLPAFWYSNQTMWIIIGLGLTVVGWNLLWGRRKVEEDAWRPAMPGQRFRTTTLYVGEECHLCEEAAELLEAYRRWLPGATTISIKSDPQLVEKYCLCVPVVAFDGKVRFRGRINETLLRRLIDGTPPLDQR